MTECQVAVRSIDQAGQLVKVNVGVCSQLTDPGRGRLVRFSQVVQHQAGAAKIMGLGVLVGGHDCLEPGPQGSAQPVLGSPRLQGMI